MNKYKLADCARKGKTTTSKAGADRPRLTRPDTNPLTSERVKPTVRVITGSRSRGGKTPKKRTARRGGPARRLLGLLPDDFFALPESSDARWMILPLGRPHPVDRLVVRYLLGQTGRGQRP